MAEFITDFGEEWLINNDISAASLTVGLYNDLTDNLDEGSVESDITTEPDTAQTYARQSSPVSSSDIGGDFGISNDSTLSFDTTDNDASVDHSFWITTVGGSDRLVAVAALDDTRNLSDFTEITIESGSLELTVT